ncbi:Putative NADH-flavin reductase [Filimonas lacunae]|uniref:Putative NADH-flavin reductase n=1 Tax=Filimonas lacunae TaxID=477680 RepID=A0A173MCL9_9BACT|nr:NAD(P)H-binding protein [Filimonas lacunae]BAV05267.1 flavin reductase [Filimonas lacunae]SIT22309.1 Putative NADH-flavin reductase [Filimonas lacunae]
MSSTIAVIGATGKSGQYLVKTLLQQGYTLRLLLRTPEKFTQHHPLVSIYKGDVTDAKDVLALVKGCSAIISTLGQPQNQPPVFSTAASNIIKAMHTHHIQRYIAVTGLSIDIPGDKKSTHITQLSQWMQQTYPAIIADKQKEYQTLANSAIDWTLVRLPVIEQTEARYNMAVSLYDCPGEKISATDLAFFLIEQLYNKQYIGKAPFIANVS